jgi:AcrR family transcriptional regulator
MVRRSTVEVRQLLLDASARAFRAKGFGRATTDEIAETAGVSMSVMFRHFPSKGDLFREALMQPFLDSMKVFSDAWKRTFSDPVDEEHVMRELISGLYDNLRAHEEAVSGLLVAEESLDAATVAEIATLFNDVFAQLGEMGVQEADRRAWFSGDSMELNARLLVGMVTATVAYRRWFLPSGRNRISRERLITHMTNLMLYGLRLAPSEVGQSPP